MILFYLLFYFFFFSSRRRHTRSKRDWSSDVCSSDLIKRKESIKKFIDILETIPRNKENEEFLNKKLKDLKDNYHCPMDSYERWHTITECIEKNDYYNACFHQLSKYELLEFIA